MIKPFFDDSQYFWLNIYHFIDILMLTHQSPDKPNYQLSTHCVDIWQIPLQQKQYLSPALTLLNSDEQQRAHRFHFAKHRRQFSLARAAMRLLLAQYIGNTHWEFDYNKYGKPYISNVSFSFNLSHSGETALLALAKSELGIDIEYFSERDYLGIAKHSFSDQEIADLSTLAKNQQAQAFFHLWAQKEALIKAEGMGLSYETQSFSVSALPPAKLINNQNPISMPWQLHSFQPDTDCWAALCCAPNISTIHYFHFDWQTFLTPGNN